MHRTGRENNMYKKWQIVLSIAYIYLYLPVPYNWVRAWTRKENLLPKQVTRIAIRHFTFEVICWCFVDVVGGIDIYLIALTSRQLSSFASKQVTNIILKFVIFGSRLNLPDSRSSQSNIFTYFIWNKRQQKCIPYAYVLYIVRLMCWINYIARHMENDWVGENWTAKNTMNTTSTQKDDCVFLHIFNERVCKRQSAHAMGSIFRWFFLSFSFFVGLVEVFVVYAKYIRWRHHHLVHFTWLWHGLNEQRNKNTFHVHRNASHSMW